MSGRPTDLGGRRRWVVGSGPVSAARHVGYRLSVRRHRARGLIRLTGRAQSLPRRRRLPDRMGILQPRAGARQESAPPLSYGWKGARLSGQASMVLSRCTARAPLTGALVGARGLLFPVVLHMVIGC